MFERFTEIARRAIFFARYEASQFGSPRIEAEHLVLGLLREDRSLREALLGGRPAVDAIRKRLEAEAASAKRERLSTSVDLPLSQECKNALAHGEQEADRLNHKHIETTHLLLGILRDEKSFGSILLREQGIDAAVIESLLATTPPPKAPASGEKIPFGAKEWGRLLRIIFGLAWHPECVDVLSQAVEQAKTLQHDIVMPEHLLLAMLLDSKSDAAQLLKEKGVTEEDIRRRLGKSDV
jgi:ATP-dependent Clp protease ATP-binding subunit ClpA